MRDKPLPNNMPLDDFFRAIFPNKPLPRTGICIECETELTEEDIDHSFCNRCWTDMFACEICGDESGDCEHKNG